MSGWGLEVFSFSNQWWLVPIIATHVGAVIGAWLYYLAIGNLATAIVRMLIVDALIAELHWQKDDDEDTEEEETNSDEAEPLPVKQQYNGDGRAPTYVQVWLPTPTLLFV